jgi:ribosome-binding factor A
VSVLGDERSREASLEGLRSAHGMLQTLLASELTLKHTPTLTFYYDESIDHGMRISQLLSEDSDG